MDRNSQGDYSRRFGWPEGTPAWVPTCACLRAKQAGDRDRETAELTAERVQSAFDHLGMGSSTELPENPPSIGQPWDNPVEAIKSGRNLILMGAVGTGKTTALKQIVKTLVSNYVPVRGGYVPQLMSALKQMDDLAEIMTSIEYGKALILDDLDKMLGTIYEIEKLSSMVNMCVQKKRPVLVSTNLSFDQLRRLLCGNKYGVPENWVDSFISRLRHNAQVVEFRGQDWRQPGNVFRVVA